MPTYMFYLFSSIFAKEPEWNKQAFYFLYDDPNKQRVGVAVLVRIAEVVECLKQGNDDEAIEKIENVSFL